MRGAQGTVAEQAVLCWPLSAPTAVLTLTCSMPGMHQGISRPSRVPHLGLDSAELQWLPRSLLAAMAALQAINNTLLQADGYACASMAAYSCKLLASQALLLCSQPEHAHGCMLCEKTPKSLACQVAAL